MGQLAIPLGPRVDFCVRFFYAAVLADSSCSYLTGLGFGGKIIYLRDEHTDRVYLRIYRHEETCAEP